MALEPLGYVEREYLLEGVGCSYDGEEAQGLPVVRSTAHFLTRMVVRSPGDSDRFNGTVVLEWFNVAGAQDAEVEWVYSHTELIRSGFAWVGVSAQRAGITGLPNPLGDGPGHRCLKQIDPERYASLVHPGDDYSYDIFSQAGAAVRAAAVSLVGWPVDVLIAAGVSLSAYRLTTYVNTVDPAARIFDGFLLHARPGNAAPLILPVDPTRVSPTPVRLRADLRVPVLVLETETDVLTLGYQHARQDDTEHLRTWEVAGAAHADTYLDLGASTDDGMLAAPRLAAAFTPADRPDGAVNCAPQHHYVANAAIAHLDRWVRGRSEPPHSPPLTIAEGAPSRFATDEHGNSLGGVRTPWVDVPLATLSGLGWSDDRGWRGGLFGASRRLPPATIRRLYGDRSDYLAAFRSAATAASRAGFLLEADLPEILDTASALFDEANRA